MRSQNVVPAVILILVGVILQLSNLGIVFVADLWPSLIILVGLGFFVMWLRNRADYGILMPASILVIVGALLQYCASFGWWNMTDFWPVFLLAPGIGFLLMYLLGIGEIGLLIPAGVMLVLGVVFLSTGRWTGWAWPLVLVAAGLLVLLKRPHSGHPGAETSPPA